MGLLRTLAPRRPPRADGNSDDGPRLHAMARLLRGGQTLLHGVYPRGRAAPARSHCRGDEERLSQVDCGALEGTDPAADRFLQGPIQTVDFLVIEKVRRSEERRVGKECRSRGWAEH